MGYVEQLLAFLKDRFTLTTGVMNVVLRSLSITDPNGTLGISVDDWTPVEWEMSGDGNLEPTLQVYTFSIQHFVKWVNAEEGERIHREVAKAIRLMLYRDPAFQVSLRALVVQEDNRKERTQKLNITDQKYASNNDSNSNIFMFMSVTVFTVETETVTLS